ncbi:MAG: hypothetical protein ACRDP7_11055, partial [Trebonia sp.]
MHEGSPEPDFIEQGGGRLKLPGLPSPGWRPSRVAGILAAVTLAIGLGAGYGLGRGTVAAHGKPAAPAGQASGGGASGTVVAVAPPPPPAIDSGPVLTEVPGTCSEQAGRDLELGIPLTNLSGETV